MKAQKIIQIESRKPEQIRSNLFRSKAKSLGVLDEGPIGTFGKVIQAIGSVGKTFGRSIGVVFLAAGIGLAVAACAADSKPFSQTDSGSDLDTDADTDTDSDSDTDTDTDTDMDTDTDSDTDTSASGDLLWAKKAGGLQNDVSHSIAVFSDGSSIVSGQLRSQVAMFGEGEANETILMGSTEDAPTSFVAQYDPDGTLEWASRSHNSSFYLACDGLSVDSLPDGSSLQLGLFEEELILGPGESNQTILVTDEDMAYFLARHNPDGTLEWATNLGARETQSLNAPWMGAFDDGSGVFASPSIGYVIFNENTSNEMTVDEEYSYLFVSGFDQWGEIGWVSVATVFDGDGFSSALGETLPDGSFLLAGSFSGTVVFAPGESNETPLASYDDTRDIYIAKFNSDGSLAWAMKEGGTDFDTLHSLGAASDGSFIIGGRSDGTATFGYGYPNATTLVDGGVFLVKYQSNGTISWAREFSSEPSLIYDVALAGDSSIFLGGSFKETVAFGLGDPNEVTFTTSESNNPFVAKCNPDGSLSWAAYASDADNEGILESVGVEGNYGIATGWFGGDLVFSPGEIYEVSLSPYGGWRADIWVAKYKL